MKKANRISGCVGKRAAHVRDRQCQAHARGIGKVLFRHRIPVQDACGKEAILEEEEDATWDDDEPSNAAGNDWWSQQPKEPEATIGPPEPPGLSDRVRSVLDFVCPGMTKAYDRWRTGYYDAYPWAPGPLHDALGDLGSLVAFGLMRIQTALVKAVNSAEIAALQNARQELLKIWDYANFPRGWALDDHLRWNLPRTFKGIDWFENGVARSNKSMHLGLKSYQDPAKVLSVGRRRVDQLVNFHGARMKDIIITDEDITERVFRLGVPPGATEAQKSALKSLIEYGKQKGITVEVISVP
jgi:hypothetical protein